LTRKRWRKKMKLRLDSRGTGIETGVGIQLSLIVTLMVAIIILYQLYIANVGPTDNTSDPHYDASAYNAWQNTRNLAWAGIGLMSVAIIVLAASVILSIVRSFGGGV